MQSNYLIQPTDRFTYSITVQESTPHSREIGDYSHTGYEVMPSESNLADIIKSAYLDYGIYYPVAVGQFETTDPIEDSEYFEKEVHKQFTLHVQHEDGRPLTQSEHDFISSLINDSSSSKVHDWAQEKYGIGGFVIGGVLGAFLGYTVGRNAGYKRGVSGYEKGGVTPSELPTNDAQSFYHAALKIANKGQAFINDNLYGTKGLAVNVKLYDIAVEVDDVINSLEVSEETKQQLRKAATASWVNSQFYFWLDSEREDTPALLKDQFSQLDEEEIYFDGRSGGYFIFDNGQDLLNATEEIHDILNDNFTSQGEWANEDETFAQWKKDEAQFAEVKDAAKYIEKETAYFQTVINYIEEAKNNMASMWEEQLKYRLTELAEDNMANGGEIAPVNFKLVGLHIDRDLDIPIYMTSQFPLNKDVTVHYAENPNSNGLVEKIYWIADRNQADLLKKNGYKITTIPVPSGKIPFSNTIGEIELKTPVYEGGGVTDKDYTFNYTATDVDKKDLGNFEVLSAGKNAMIAWDKAVDKLDDTHEYIELITINGLSRDEFSEDGQQVILITPKLPALFKRFRAIDYFYTKDRINTQISNWNDAVKNGDEKAAQYTEQDVIDSVNTQALVDWNYLVEKTEEMIAKKDKAELKSRIRYDQKAMLAIYEALTGDKLLGMSNKKLHAYFDGDFEGGGEVDDILSIISQSVEDNVEEVDSKYEFFKEWDIEEVESESRDGFIPFTDGGTSATNFTTISYLYGSGTSLPTSALVKEFDRQVDYSHELAKEEFIENNPELVEELGEDKMNYHDLQEAGYSDKAEELDALEDGTDDSVMFELGAYYYAPENDRGEDGKHTVLAYAVVNLEGPYHRRGNLEDFKEIQFTFDSTDELETELQTALTDLIDWMNGGQYESNRELKIARMARGGDTQGYDDKLDDSLGERDGKEANKRQSLRSRRDESTAMEKAKAKRKYSAVETMDKLEEGGELAEWAQEALNDLKEIENNQDLVVVTDGTDFLRVESGDYAVEYDIYRSESEAEQAAIERVTEDLEGNPEYFTPSWLLDHIDAGDFFKDMFDEWDREYVVDIADEDSDDYSSRLVEEMVQWEIMTEDEAKADNAQEIAEERMDDYAEKMTQDKLDEGNNGYNHYKFNFGEVQAAKLIIENKLIDINAAAEDAVNTDGIPHFLSSYDGEQIDLVNGAVAYRTN